MKFEQFDLKEPILRSLREAGYDEPTPIQEQAIPVLLRGGDLIGIAETGTGKTLAYLIPIFQRWKPGGDDPEAVVVCPTRELAIQVAGEAERFGAHLGIRVELAYGGTSVRGQQQALASGCDLLVATPGRLLDFVNSAWLSLRRARFVVLDEADRMLDMGFINDVDAILRRTPMSRQTMLFSATFPDEIRKLADRYMMHPETVKMHTGTKVKASVDHVYFPVRSRQKQDLLVALLRRDKPTKVLIFCATREGTSELATHLRRKGFSVIALSSLLSQTNRERTLDAFRSGDRSMLVATDVAARGLDITDIDLVVNFDLPMTSEEYVHRIGRTGRAQKAGRAVTLVSELDGRRIADIEKLLGHPVPEERLEGFPYDEVRISRATRGRGGRPRGAPRKRSGGGSRGAAKERSGGGSRGAAKNRSARRKGKRGAGTGGSGA